ncbi:DUF6069 family protein [Streptacidiphilus sp. N1-10]|uniref:DUF6069 family protein n=1 Tax=Streptacidiphilus jeojiensis TaxID=3229225 RepID=A0ABV6XNK3_9ACTN
MSQPTPSELAPPAARRAVATAAALLAVIVVGGLLDTAIAAIAHSAGASRQFKPLEAGSYSSFTAFGVLIGAAGWAIVRRRARDPRALLVRLAPLVLALSFIPDLLLLAVSAQADAAAVIALLAMHIVVAACAIASYLWALPLAATSQRRTPDQSSVDQSLVSTASLRKDRNRAA